MTRQRWVVFPHFPDFVQENPQKWYPILIRQALFSPLGGPNNPIPGFTDRYYEYLQLHMGDFEKIDFQPFYGHFKPKFLQKSQNRPKFGLKVAIKQLKIIFFKIPHVKLQIFIISVSKTWNGVIWTTQWREKCLTDQNLGPDFRDFPIQNPENA